MTEPVSTAEAWTKEILSRADPTEVICRECNRFQEKYSHKPTMIAVNAAVWIKLTKEQRDSFCCNVKPFVASALSLETLPDANWLMIMDEDGVFKEFL